VSRIASELKKVGPRLVNLHSDSSAAILFSADSANAIRSMPFSDRVDYMTVMRQMYDALYTLNVAPDIVQAEHAALDRYKVVLVPPLYSASDEVLRGLCDYVHRGGHVVMAFKSGFTDQFSTVRHVMAPGPLRVAAGFHYQEFTSLPEPRRLTPDAYAVGDQNMGSVWQEFLLLDTAEAVATFDHSYWRYPAITRNTYGKGTLTYEATVVTEALQRAIIRDTLSRAGLVGHNQRLPEVLKVRDARSPDGKQLHFYFNFSGGQQSFSYPSEDGADLLTERAVRRGQTITLQPWDLAIIMERLAKEATASRDPR
jgi:beta-galactosidase